MDNSTFATAVPDMGLAGIKMAGALFLLLALIFLGFYLLRKFGPKMGFANLKSRDLSYHSQLSLGPKKSVVVVRFLNKYLVLGVTDSQITKLTEMDADHDHPPSEDFSTTLRQTHRSQDPD
ncbi:MAG: flagellar biosynthetic protein FliO [Desulfovibrionales bacterium]